MAEPKVSLAGRVDPEVYDEVMRIASDEDRTQMRPLPDEPLARFRR